MTRRPLARAFVDAAGERLPSGPEADDALEAALARFTAAGSAAWPKLAVPPQALAAYVGTRSSREPVDLANDERAADLHIACAVVLQVPGAARAFEARFFPDLEGALARMRISGGTEDLKQALRMQLLVGDGAKPPKIAEYGGRGDLRGWLRVTAVRAALKVLRKAKGELLVDEDARMASEAPDGDPELGYIKQVYRPAFRAAFQAALDSLDDREKNILRQHIVDGLGIDDLGALYKVHRATAARWLARARESLLQRTRKQFMDGARVSHDECDSILRQVQSQLDGTIRRRLESVRP